MSSQPAVVSHALWQAQPALATARSHTARSTVQVVVCPGRHAEVLLSIKNSEAWGIDEQDILDAVYTSIK